MFSLYLDEDSLDRVLVRSLREQGLDVLTTDEAGRRGAEDHDQLAFAAEQGRVIFTSNAGDFTRLHRDWLQSGRHHAGIIVLVNQRSPISDQTRAFLRLVDEHSAETMRDRLEFLRNWIT